MIVGIGVDMCSVERFDAMLQRTPGIVETLFTLSERQSHELPRPVRSLAARFAAKEALAKALGAPRGPHGMTWLDAEIVSSDDGQPSFGLSGSVAQRAKELGVTRTHLSLTHDGGLATAFVVLETD